MEWNAIVKKFCSIHFHFGQNRSCLPENTWAGFKMKFM